MVYAVVLLYTVTSILCIFSQDRRSSNKYRFCSHIHTIFTLVILVLARPHNIVLVAMMVIQEVLIEKYIWSVLELSTVECWTLYFLWMGHGSFFYQVKQIHVYLKKHFFKGIPIWIFVVWRLDKIDFTKFCSVSDRFR